MGCWQLAFLGLGIASLQIAKLLDGSSDSPEKTGAGSKDPGLVNDDFNSLEWTLQLSAAAGALAMLASLPIARFLFRRARSSVVLAALLIPAGLVGMYFLVPRVSYYVIF